MKNMRSLVSNGLMIGGLLTTVGSAVDSAQNSALQKEFQQRQVVTDLMQDIYGVHKECSSYGGGMWAGGFIACTDEVEGNHSENEERDILERFSQDLNDHLGEIPHDSQAHTRGLRDGLGLVGGLGVAAAGLNIRRRKEGM